MAEDHDEPELSPLALGMTVHEVEGESPQMCVFLANEDGVVGILDPETALQIGTALIALCVEARVMQHQLATMTPEEQGRLLEEVRRRYVAPQN